MPKLLSQFKHEKPELNSSLHIKSQKEIRAKSEKYGTLQEFLQGYKNFENLQNFTSCEFLQCCETAQFLFATIHALCALFTSQPCDIVPAARLNFYLFFLLLISSYFVLVTVNCFC